MMPDDFDLLLARFAETIEACLDDILGLAAASGEIARPPRLVAAMRHAVLAGGKRLRPFLLVEAARLFGGEPAARRALPAAAAVECLHCYSLAHDDLPSMDNDDLRRGRPTLHRAFDEATAILAGDALQALAFDLLADPRHLPDPALRATLVLDLSRASGLGGMVGGQMLDLAAEGRFGADAPAAQPIALSDAAIRQLQAMKTGALIRACVLMGARIGGADDAGLARLRRYGDIVGLAFQLADDLLDATGDAAVVGKATAKDAGAGKATLVGLNGIDQVRAELAQLVAEAAALLAPHGTAGQTLQAAARFVAARNK